MRGNPLSAFLNSAEADIRRGVFNYDGFRSVSSVACWF